MDGEKAALNSLAGQFHPYSEARRRESFSPPYNGYAAESRPPFTVPPRYRSLYLLATPHCTSSLSRAYLLLNAGFKLVLCLLSGSFEFGFLVRHTREVRLQPLRLRNKVSYAVFFRNKVSYAVNKKIKKGPFCCF